MTGRRVSVQAIPRNHAQVADHLKAGVLALERARGAGLIRRAEEWFALSRRGGHALAGLLAVAVLFLSAGPTGGIRPFLERLDRRQRSRLAGLVGERVLPTAASMSRALGRFEHDQVRPFLARLLAAPLDGIDILSHPAVCHRDALGDPWHVLDIDPTVDAFRQRELPEGSELGQPVRRAPGEPGYTGRKRGELRVRAIPVMHDGAGLWLAMHLVAREGSIVPTIGAVTRTSVDTLTSRGVPDDRIIVRGDGEHGSAGAINAITANGAQALVRMSRYTLMDRDEVIARMPTLQWSAVRCGESGVQREAADLGMFTLEGATDADEEAIVRVRIVLTRFPRTSPPDHGVLRDGYQIEMFATTAAADRWPAADIAELYAGRSALENRFAQEDREFGLDRTFSFHPPGQEWMWGVGLYLWNEQVSTGWKKQPPPSFVPDRTARPAPSPCPVDVETAAAARPPDVEILITPAPVEADIAAPSATTAVTDGDEARIALAEVVGRAFASVTRWPGWTLDPKTAVIRCPQQRVLVPYAVSPSPPAARAAHAGYRIHLRTEPRACGGCPLREGCFPVDRVGPYKQISRTVTAEDHATVAGALAALREAMPPGPPPPRRSAASHPRRPRPDTAVYEHLPPVAPGPWWFERPRFLPAAAREVTRTMARAATLLLTFERPVRRPLARPAAGHPLLARDTPHRAHRRRPWRELGARRKIDTPVRVTNSPASIPTHESHESSH